MSIPLPEGLLDLLRRPSTCFLATVMPDGSPQLTQTWVTTDGEHIVINTVEGNRKSRNIARDPRVAVTIADPEDASRYYGVRGRVIDVTADGAAESIDEISHKYIGRPYPGFSGRPETRLLLTIAVDSVAHAPRG
ncbi:PPOX class F420-dependent oxidoreductase [Streptomyces sp. TS71-3]|uniref:PPOX class F420-dependent oxidoreductase n=1 Tax=Streptomyces sp. TS71-3 TaxID=2733862 RepID=UPI001B1B0B62|nr:PPOX class F420-dependent oxidoreductase [Streptomyces sp. TS71-3]GHJ34442.1 PPOX class F420-dependent enzyme [Streptomyces sp. TS71-3]